MLAIGRGELPPPSQPPLQSAECHSDSLSDAPFYQAHGIGLTGMRPHTAPYCMTSVPIQPPQAPPSPNAALRLKSFFDSLQARTTVLVVALVVTVAILVSGYFLRASVELLSGQHNEELTQLGAVLAQAAAVPIANDDHETLEVIAEELVNGAPLLYVVFTDVDGNELAGAIHGGQEPLKARLSGKRDRSMPAGQPLFVAGIEGVPGYLDISYPVSRRSEKTSTVDQSVPHLVGYVRAGIVAMGWRQMLASKFDLLLGLGIIAVALAMPLGFLLVRRITRPLAEMEQAMMRFSRGELSVRSKAGRDDEIGRLARAFNRMADLHQQNHQRILKLNGELESRVAQRTRQLRELAVREPLTGLYNRRYFAEMVDRCFAEAIRYDNDLTCLMMDLDNFKGINDRLGHHVGDDLLVLIAGIISSQLRSSDIPARYGGDEFIILLPQTGPLRAEVLAERIMERYTAETALRLPNNDVGISIGIASLLAVGAKEPSSLIRAADHALYRAKASGKNRIVVAGENPLSPVS